MCLTDSSSSRLLPCRRKLHKPTILTARHGLGSGAPQKLYEDGANGRYVSGNHQFQRVAQRQQAKAYELRAAMSMARLWRDQGKRDEARDLLAPVYRWFTEEFDTLDLKEAKKLFDELAS
jgi:hypothetical protein